MKSVKEKSIKQKPKGAIGNNTDYDGNDVGIIESERWSIDTLTY